MQAESAFETDKRALLALWPPRDSKAGGGPKAGLLRMPTEGEEARTPPSWRREGK